MPRLLTSVLALALALLLTAQATAAAPDRSGVKSLDLGPGTELYVMNGRLGSRQLFALDLKTGRADVGALGFNQSARLPWERLHQSSLELDVELNGQALYRKEGPVLKDRALQLGFTFACAGGTDASGLRLTHCVISPLALAPSLEDESELKTAIVPVFYHLLTVENLSGEPQSAEVVFGLGREGVNSRSLEPGVQVIELPEPRTNRFSSRPPQQALATTAADSWYISGPRNGFIFNFSLDPGAAAERTVIQAAYTAEPVLKSRSTGSGYRFYYTRFWKSLDEVIQFAADRRDELLHATAATEARLARADLSPERRWLMALTFHTYLANTWLVTADDAAAEFYVWEGDYAMMSTLDVAHEVEVLAAFMPWTLKLQLREWARNTHETKWGPYLAHDLGRDQVVDKPFYDNWLNRFLKHAAMPVEENANYALLLFWYDHLTHDRETVSELIPVMETMLLACRARDTDGNGIADQDTGTTYDASEAIHLAPNNVYLGVKQMAADLVGADLLERYGRTASPDELRSEARKILSTLTAASERYGYLPIALDPSYQGWDQASVVLGDGLLYPALTGFRSPELEALIPILAQSFTQALERSRREWGVVMTEGEGTIFYSKVMVLEPVASLLYHVPAELWEPPYQWNLNNDHAYNDGAYSAEKDWSGYKYPRGVISMWPLLPGLPEGGSGATAD